MPPAKFSFRAIVKFPAFLWKKWQDRRSAGHGIPPLRDWIPMMRRVAASYYPFEALGLRPTGASLAKVEGGRGALLESLYAQMLLSAQGATRKMRRALSYVARTDDKVDASHISIKTIAFYLPQFYPIPENDSWWGKGFTEWTNVSKAVPQFVGHYQPHLPDELGFYDLRVPEVLRQQAAIARQYGIHGFCFYHYWFSGKRLLEKPLDQFLADDKVDIPFCLCWANESWSRVWEGAKTQILMAQEYSQENDLAFIESLLPAFKDPRYIRVDGKPLLIVYRVTELPDAAATARLWRERVAQAGLPGIYLVAAKSFEVRDPRPFGFDAAVEFPPHQVALGDLTSQAQILNTQYKGHIHSYEELALKYAARAEEDFVNFKTVMPSWDNEARRPGQGNSFIGSTPELYAAWLAKACDAALKLREEERFVFINAWNEWAEGTHLEPDRKYGFAYLHATANVLRRHHHDVEKSNFIDACNAEFKKHSDTALLFHCHYEDVFESVATTYLEKMKDADLYLSFRPDFSLETLKLAKQRFNHIYFVPVENRGRDVLPFLTVLDKVKSLGYDYACKIHSKRSPHLLPGLGEQWRDKLLGPMLGGADPVAKARALFAHSKKTGLLVPKGCLVDCEDPGYSGSNRIWLDKLLKAVGKEKMIGDYRFEFPAGSMYWFRLAALEGLDRLVLSTGHFEDEVGQVDGTLAHAVERFVGLYAELQGYAMKQIDWHGEV